MINDFTIENRYYEFVVFNNYRFRKYKYILLFH